MEFFKTSELQSVTVALVWTDHNCPPQGFTYTGDGDTHVVQDTGSKWGCPDSSLMLMLLILEKLISQSAGKAWGDHL